MKSADKILSKRYARAYMDLGTGGFDKQGGAAAAARIAELEKVRDATGKFMRLFLHPLVGADDKAEILGRLLSKELLVSRAAGFLRLLIKENRVYLLETVLGDCVKLHDEYSGLSRAEVVSRHPLSAEELKQVAAMLQASTGKSAQLTQKLSEAVLGGMEIRMGDLLIDASVKGRLEKLRKSVVQ